MIYILLYFLIGILVTLACRLYDKEPYILGFVFFMVIFWPILIILFIVHCLSTIEI